MSVDIKNYDDTQADFQDGTLTDVEADAGDYLGLLTGGEVGSVATTATTNFAYDIVSLARSYDNPLVFALMTTYNGAGCSIARVNNIVSDSFDVGIAEAVQAAGADNGHVSEDVSYLVLEDQGRYQSFDDRTIEVGTIDLTDVNTRENTGTAIPWTTVNFSSAFGSAPIVLAQVQTQNNGHIFLKCRITNVTTSSFDVVLERHGNNTVASLTNAETVAWVAVAQGTGTDVDVGTIDVAGDLDATTVWDTLSYGITFSSVPIFIAWDQTTAGLDAAEIRCQNNAVGSIDLTCEEDTTYDTKQSHATETVGYIALESSLVWYKNSGNRLSPQLDLSAVGTVESSSISWTKQYIQDVLSFDGVDDYVDVGGGVWDNSNNAITIEFWAKQDLLSNHLTCFGGDGEAWVEPYKTATLGTSFCLYDTSNTEHIFTSGYIISADVWYHFAFVFDGSTGYIYVNGNLKSSTAGTFTFKAQTTGYIGSYSGGSNVFPGDMSDVRVWNIARTQAQIQADMNNRLTGNETGLVAYYKLDESTGTTATDSAGTNNGTINGATWTTDDLSDIFDVLTIETRVSLDNGSTWTSWTAATNSGSIPGLTAGDDVSNGLLECKQLLSTNDSAITPELSNLSLAINSVKWSQQALKENDWNKQMGGISSWTKQGLKEASWIKKNLK